MFVRQLKSFKFVLSFAGNWPMDARPQYHEAENKTSRVFTSKDQHSTGGNVASLNLCVLNSAAASSLGRFVRGPNTSDLASSLVEALALYPRLQSVSVHHWRVHHCGKSDVGHQKRE